MVASAPLVAAVVVMAGRVGATARFVTWPIVAFTALAAAVALVGLWFALDRPPLLAVGVLPALPLAYLLPAMRVAFVACALVGLGVLATRARGMAAGVAMTVGALLTLSVVVQGPAVECSETSVSAGSGPWWVPAPSGSHGSSISGTDRRSSGTTQVGEQRYTFVCVGDQLTKFQRVD